MRELGRVLLVAPGGPPVTGIESVTRSLLVGLAQIPEIRWRHYNTSKPVPNDRRGHLSVANLFWTLRHLVGVAWVCFRFRPDIVHLPLAHNRLGFLRDACYILVARITGARVVSQAHNDSYDRFLASQPAVLRPYIRWIYGLSSSILVPGESLRSQFDAFGLADRVRTLPNHLDVDAYAAPGERVRSPEHPYTILLLGRVSFAKGAWDLARAGMQVARDLGRPVRVRLTGEVVARDESVAHLTEQSTDVMSRVRDLLRDVPDSSYQVDYLGVLDDETRHAALLETDVLALPSYSEASPYAILEGAASGLPVVASAVGMIPELFERGLQGVLVEPGDVPGLAGALTQLADGDLRREAGAANARFVRAHFDNALLPDRLRAVYGIGHDTTVDDRQ